MKKLLYILSIFISFICAAQTKTQYISTGKLCLEYYAQPEYYKVSVYNDTEYLLVLGLGTLEEAISKVDEMIVELESTSIGSNRDFVFKTGVVRFMKLQEPVGQYAPPGIALDTFERKCNNGPNYVLTEEDLRKLRKALLKSQKKKK